MGFVTPARSDHPVFGQRRQLLGGLVQQAAAVAFAFIVLGVALLEREHRRQRGEGAGVVIGGLKVSPDAGMLNVSGEVIPGLYAAGETMGLYYGYYGVYPGATSVLRGAVFGRRAGLHAGQGNA